MWPDNYKKINFKSPLLMNETWNFKDLRFHLRFCLLRLTFARVLKSLRLKKIISSVKFKMLLSVCFTINWKKRIERNRSQSLNTLCSHLLARAYLGLDGLLLAHQLRPQDEHFLFADIKLLTHRGQLLHEDTVGWRTWSSHLWGTFFAKGLA